MKLFSVSFGVVVAAGLGLSSSVVQAGEGTSISASRLVNVVQNHKLFDRPDLIAGRLLKLELLTELPGREVSAGDPDVAALGSDAVITWRLVRKYKRGLGIERYHRVAPGCFFLARVRYG